MIYKSTRSDVNVIRHDSETKTINGMVWVPRKEKLADPGTKSDSQLTHALHLMLYDGILCFYS